MVSEFKHFSFYSGVCLSFFFRLQQPLVRLRGGAIVGEGRVEVLKNGEWGTICDDNWSLLSATVVCRELGFGTAKEALSGGRLGQGIPVLHFRCYLCKKSQLTPFFSRSSLYIQNWGLPSREDSEERDILRIFKGFLNRITISLI